MTEPSHLAAWALKGEFRNINSVLKVMVEEYGYIFNIFRSEYLSIQADAESQHVQEF